MANRATHENLNRNHGFKASSPARFGLSLAGLCFLLAAYRFFIEASLWIPLFTTGLVFSLIALLMPNWLSPFNRLWIGFGMLLARITNPIILFIVYFGFITPLGLLYRLFSKEKFRRERASLWEPPSASKNMNQQY